MKILTIVGAVAVIIGLAIVIAFRILLPRALVATGRGSIQDVASVTVTRVAVANETRNFEAKTVRAGDGYKYILVDCRIAAEAGSIDFDDFQLVRNRAAKLGEEENVGNNDDIDAFFWVFLDASGAPVPEVPGSTSPVSARLSFKVPADAGAGYLFYWGMYWGPFSFHEAGKA